jgi:hypothetical protein
VVVVVVVLEVVGENISKENPSKDKATVPFSKKCRSGNAEI